MDEEDPSRSVVAVNPNLESSLLLVPIALGLCIYIFTFCSQRVKGRLFGQSLYTSIRWKESELRGVQHTHMSLFTLLGFDTFTAIFGIMYMAFVLRDVCQREALGCLIISKMWMAFRRLSLSQHLITALVAVLFLYRPKWASGIRLVGKCLDAPPFILVIVTVRLFPGVIVAVDVFNLLLMVSIAVVCLKQAQTRMAKQRRLLGVLAAVTYVLVCLPNAVLDCLLLKSHDYLPLAFDVFCITNFYFVLDALLFYLVLKINVEEEEPQYEAAIREV
uniref:Uncharacterized protein n=1 Tax=Knipowitschia caucasica TaxID=637954 RepID=A0AAV2KL37_KNICA